mmetsp:Transcript_10444/g.10071  ORF Transcript_10444/g.10071 Transcript_10444/m.10071 type:complete len:243 (-) Transcript_10444:217-945(-)|eukprot:CAMPEP_0119042358 /NCGR_PEP_ID=MMETSP1177-20130426/14757_1 /TAXON_ID=2985 /ORGANISM="Ochromonas sp, Strain CCMP1899" /LENGTH=242 /DNA_ID=CAMNT_0007009101 /DNA_START=68 /DNA_END=796 /DNA_ORIENTATION=+
MLGLIVSAALVVSSNAFLQPRFAGNVVVRQEIALSAIKPDLFSDDLFDDEDDAPKKKAKDAEPKKDKYLDQKWKLSEEDGKEFKGWDKKETKNVKKPEFADEDDDVEIGNLPLLALIYNFGRDFKDADLTATLAEHTSYCEPFKRLFNSEMLQTTRGRGMVLLWAGLNEDDDNLKQEIMAFMEDDPFIVKNIVDNWDIQSLDPAVLEAEASMAIPDYDELPDVLKLENTPEGQENDDYGSKK